MPSTQLEALLDDVKPDVKPAKNRYEELDQKLYEKNHLTLEDHVSKLSRGVVKLSQAPICLWTSASLFHLSRPRVHQRRSISIFVELKEMLSFSAHENFSA